MTPAHLEAFHKRLDEIDKQLVIISRMVLDNGVGWFMPVDTSKGEWRCECVPREKGFDNSVNPSFVSGCGKCGRLRPKVSK